MEKNQSSIGKTFAAALVAILTFALADAHAVTVNGANVTAPPGSAFDVAFDFDFGADTGISSFLLDLTFDTARVTFAGLTSATYQGTAYTPTAVETALNGAGTYSQTTDATGLHASWFALDPAFQPLPPLHLSGPAKLVYSFTLLAGVTPGTTTDVELMLTYSDADLNPVDPAGHIVTVSAGPVNAVPEAATWVLLAAGLGLLGVLRRRTCWTEAKSSAASMSGWAK